jgi:sugar phosphate isomerase/epimerase
MLRALALTTLALTAPSPFAAERGSSPDKHALGVCSICYTLRWPEVNRGKAPLAQVLEFVEYARALGAGGVQTSIRSEPEFIKALREKVEASNLYLEGQLSLPRFAEDVDKFDSAVAAAKEAGARVLRTACLGTRRYETFHDAQAFREFTQQSERALGLAEPVVRKHRVRLAVENHKDWRVPELVQLMQRLNSEYIGICLDTGNSIALLEDPMAVVEAYAPYAFATHLKDMGVREFDQGFLLSEVALGDGFLDLPAMVSTLQRHHPDLHFSLEMIARDPLRVPCLSPGYWATFDDVPGRLLAATLARVRANATKQPLPTVTGLAQDQKLDLEDQLVRRSFAYARQHLQL